MEIYLLDVKSVVDVNGNDVAHDYINTYTNFIDAANEALRLSSNKSMNIVDMSIHKWIIKEDGTQEHSDDIDSIIRFTNKDNSTTDSIAEEFGNIIGDEIYSPLDLLAHCGYDYEDVDEEISLEEFEEAYPNLWTYPLTDMGECLRNNKEAMIVRFFEPTKEDGFVYRVCQGVE